MTRKKIILYEFRLSVLLTVKYQQIKASRTLLKDNKSDIALETDPKM